MGDADILITMTVCVVFLVVVDKKASYVTGIKRPQFSKSVLGIWPLNFKSSDALRLKHGSLSKHTYILVL